MVVCRRQLLADLPGRDPGLRVVISSSKPVRVVEHQLLQAMQAIPLLGIDDARDDILADGDLAV